MASFSKKPYTPFGVYSLADLQDASTVVVPQSTPAVALAPSSDSENVVTPTSNNVVPLTIQGQASQSKDLLRGEDNLGNILFSFDPEGDLLLAGSAAISGEITVAGASQFDATVAILGTTRTGSLIAPDVTLNSASVSGNVTVSGNITSSGSVLVAGSSQFNSPITVTPGTGSRCLTLNSTTAATIFVNAASGTLRSNLRLPTYQILTDSPLSSTNDLIFQNLNTGRNPLQLGADDRVTLGYTNTVVMVSGDLGVGVLAQHPLHLLDSEVESWFDSTSSEPQVIRGWTINKPDPTDGLPHGLNWCVSGTVYWQIGQDFDTLDGGGNSDFINCYDATANSGAGADIMRFCPANTNPYGQTLCSLGINGTPRFSSSLFFLRPVAYNLGGLGMVLSGGIAVDAAYDQTTAALQNVPLIGYRFGGSTQNVFSQRQISLAQITNGSTSGNRNYVLLNGALSGTASTPLFNSSNTQYGPTFGIEGTDTALSLFAAPVGNNQSPVYGLVMDTGGNLTALRTLFTSGSLTASGTLLVEGSSQFNSPITVTPNTGSRCLTLNSTLAATIFIVPSSGTLRANWRMPTYQILTDSTLTSTNDLIFQNLNTGRFPFQMGALDDLTLGVATRSVVLSGSLLATTTSQFNATATFSPPSGGQCLTLNSTFADTVHINAASGTLRSNIRFPTYQIVTDSSLTSANDLIFQNLGTGNIPFQLLSTDQIVLGLSASTVTVSGSLSHTGPKWGIFGATPVTKPTVSGSRGSNAALQSLLTALSGLGIVIDSSTT